MNLKIDKKTSTAYSNVIIVVQSRQLEGTREVNIGMKAAKRQNWGRRTHLFPDYFQEPSSCVAILLHSNDFLTLHFVTIPLWTNHDIVTSRALNANPHNCFASKKESNSSDNCPVECLRSRHRSRFTSRIPFLLSTLLSGFSFILLRWTTTVLSINIDIFFNKILLSLSV